MSSDISKCFLLCLVSCLFSTCSIGPKYRTPTAPVPPAFKEPVPSSWKTATPQDGTLRGNWWEMFGDPQLNDLEAQVNVSNQNIAAIEAQFRSARAAIRVARAGLFPTLTATGAATTSRTSPSRSVGVGDRKSVV